MSFFAKSNSHLLVLTIGFLCCFYLASAQEGLRMQYLEAGEYIMQAPSVLRENKVKEIRFVLVSKKRNEIVESGYRDTSRTFHLKGGFPDGFGDMVADVDSLTGQFSQILYRRGIFEDYEFFRYNSSGQLRCRMSGTMHVDSQWVNIDDSFDYQYDEKGRLIAESHCFLNLFPRKRHTVNYEFDANGHPSGEIQSFWKYVAKSRQWVEDKQPFEVEIRNQTDTDNRLIRREYLRDGETVALDSLTYVPDGRLFSLIGWDKLHPSYPQYRKMQFDGEGRLSTLLMQYPHHKRRKRIEFAYNDYGLLMQYSYYNEKNRAVVMELHYEFYR